MIEVIAKKIILRDIVEKKKSSFHSVSATSNDEILSLCFHYADENIEIQEKFATFLDFEQPNREHIAW